MARSSDDFLHNFGIGPNEPEQPKVETYDEEPYFDAEIAPLLRQLKEKCLERNLPLIVGMAYGHEERGYHVALVAAMVDTTPGRVPPHFPYVWNLLKDPPGSNSENLGPAVE